MEILLIRSIVKSKWKIYADEVEYILFKFAVISAITDETVLVKKKKI